jgi:transcriptional regulator with XRE-family HTH domain
MEARPLSELLGDVDALLAQHKQHQEQWKNVGSHLRSVRKAAGFSQAKIEAETGIPQAYLSQIENNVKTPTTSTVEAVTTALHTLTAGGTARGDQGKEGQQAPDRRPSAKADAAKARRRK